MFLVSEDVKKGVQKIHEKLYSKKHALGAESKVSHYFALILLDIKLCILTRVYITILPHPNYVTAVFREMALRDPRNQCDFRVDGGSCWWRHHECYQQIVSRCHSNPT